MKTNTIIDGIAGQVRDDGITFIGMIEFCDGIINTKYNNAEAKAYADKMIADAIERDKELRKNGGFAGIPCDRYALECGMLRQWIKANNAFYYSRGNEQFSTFEAIHLAKKEGKNIIVLDNLS